jgi:DNA-binding NtrC family response regulator
MTSATKLLLVDDDELIVSMLSRILKAEGYDVRTLTSPAEVLRKVRSWSPDVVLMDIRMPGRSGIELLEDLMARGNAPQVVMLTADDTAETAVKAMKLGAVDYLTKPFNAEEVKIVLRNIVEKGRLTREVVYLRGLHDRVVEREIIGEAPAVRELQERVEKMAKAAVTTLLITGESGSGKELFARYAHRFVAERAGGDGFAPFVQVNCAAVPEALLESELFGHEKGAFTDAREDKKGLFELAQGGTLLLDEIGEMPLKTQAKLLRVLEERAVLRVGGLKPRPIDVRVLAATNRDLRAEIAQGTFRADLYYRLNGLSLTVPPLRERGAEIVPLAEYFCTRSAEALSKSRPSFDPETLLALTRYEWPGNVRELRSVIERAVLLSRNGVIVPDNLPDEVVRPPAISRRMQTSTMPPPSLAFGDDDEGSQVKSLPHEMEKLERRRIMDALEKCHGNQTRAAALLGMSRRVLISRMERYNLPRPRARR